jgi:hypothetical protein
MRAAPANRARVRRLARVSPPRDFSRGLAPPGVAPGAWAQCGENQGEGVCTALLPFWFIRVRKVFWYPFILPGRTCLPPFPDREPVVSAASRRTTSRALTAA